MAPASKVKAICEGEVRFWRLWVDRAAVSDNPASDATKRPSQIVAVAAHVQGNLPVWSQQMHQLSARGQKKILPRLCCTSV